MNSTGDSAAVKSVPSLPVICGPTASGKSALALRLGELTGAAIISADSRQVYRGFDIGTAKPSPEEQGRVLHHGIDVVEPDERYTAADWAAAVPGWIRECERNGQKPIIVGGTGFYLRALFAPLFEEPHVDDAQRSSVRDLLATMTGEEIRRWCDAIDPSRAVLGRAQRERAIEVALITGHRISELHVERPRATALTGRYLVVDPGPILSVAIGNRIEAMLKAGWLDEIRALMERVEPTARAWTATGYDTMRSVVKGDIALEKGRELVTIATRQYAKRQRTWFRHQLAGEDVLRIDIREPGAFERAVTWLHGEEMR